MVAGTRFSFSGRRTHLNLLTVTSLAHLFPAGTNVTVEQTGIGLSPFKSNLIAWGFSDLVETEMYLARCPACDSGKFATLFASYDYPVQRCGRAGWCFSTLSLVTTSCRRTYSADYFLGGTLPKPDRPSSASRGAQPASIWKVIRYGGARTRQLLEVGCGRGELLGGSGCARV